VERPVSVTIITETHQLQQAPGPKTFNTHNCEVMEKNKNKKKCYCISAVSQTVSTGLL